MRNNSIIAWIIVVVVTFFPRVSGSAEQEVSMYKEAVFAGGCFWCTEAAFESIDGVEKAESGYMGGNVEKPSYEEVAGGNTGHREVVRIVYDPDKVPYEKLLNVFWQSIDPTDEGGQFADRGEQYKTAIFYYDDEQKRIAEKSKSELEKSGKFEKKIATEILKAGSFYKAEEYHQDYSRKEPERYKQYKKGSGREEYIKETWQVPVCGINIGKEALKDKLTPLQYKVTQEAGTERPFDNEYWDNEREGIYVDIVSGEPLFSSKDKFKSGTGWPSFTKPIASGRVTEKEDNSLLMKRTEVKSSKTGAHLGHVFDDGPGPDGKRYCINSAAPKFIPEEDIEKEGYDKEMYK